ncbi:putative plastid-lipid-associated protein 8, chloroplastic [Dirofilaria immitis]
MISPDCEMISLLNSFLNTNLLRIRSSLHFLDIFPESHEEFVEIIDEEQQACIKETKWLLWFHFRLIMADEALKHFCIKTIFTSYKAMKLCNKFFIISSNSNFNGRIKIIEKVWKEKISIMHVK